MRGRELRHRTISLTPCAEKVIQTSMVHFVQTITPNTGRESNFSISINLIILARLVHGVTRYRRGEKPDSDALNWMMDLIDGRVKLTQQDLEDYAKLLTYLTDEYNKRHTHQNTKNHQ